MSSADRKPRRPHGWWLVVAFICLGFAIVVAGAAVVMQREASKPIGEGEVFAKDAKVVEELIDHAQPSISVRKARNELGIEAVSLIDASGSVLVSTSENLVGTTLVNPLLLFGAGEGRFSALAAPVPHPVFVDGVAEWGEGSILYQVVSPIDAGGAALLFYDIEELLARRVRSAGIQTETAQLLGLTALFALLGGLVYIGYTRSARRHHEMLAESDMLRLHAEELRRANADLAEARSRAEGALALAEEKIRIRSDFVLMINHELRTPLTSVVTGARLLRDQKLSPSDRSQVVEAIVEDGTRLQEIIDQILVVARIENRGLSYSLEEVESSVLVSALGSASAEISCNGLTTTVRTDIRALTQVIASLADNARTHGASEVVVGCSSESKILPAVEVGHRPDHAFFVTVTDDGPGINPEFLPRIFEKFEKSSFSPGTGLGLYMARLVVEALGGSIGVETGPDGTTFQVAIPLVVSPKMVMR